MIKKATLSLLACIAAAGCAAPYDNPPSQAVAVRPSIPGPIPPVAPAIAPTPALQLRRAGSVVGFPVVDPVGQPVGTVQAVAVVRETGEVRDLVIASPSFGPGYYISVPAENAQSTGDRVILNGPMVSWMQAPRYAAPQISEMYGSF